MQLTADDRHFSAETMARVAEKSVTLLRDRRKRLPLKRGQVKSALIVAIAPDDQAYEEMHFLAQELEDRGMGVTLRRNISPAELPAVQGEYGLIFYALASRPHRPRGPLGFFGPEADSIWASLTSGAGKSIVVSFGSPYHIDEYCEAADIYVNAYSIEEASQRAVVRALFGEIGFAGHSPVRLGDPDTGGRMH